MADNNLLQEAVKALAERLEKTEKFVLDQAPDICKQMVKEAVIDRWFYIGITTAVTFGLSFAERFAIGQLVEWYAVEHARDVNPGLWILAVLAGAAMVLFSVIALELLKDLVIIRNCPKLFLLREFKKLLAPESDE